MEVDQTGQVQPEDLRTGDHLCLHIVELGMMKWNESVLHQRWQWIIRHDKAQQGSEMHMDTKDVLVARHQTTGIGSIRIILLLTGWHKKAGIPGMCIARFRKKAMLALEWDPNPASRGITMEIDKSSRMRWDTCRMLQ